MQCQKTILLLIKKKKWITNDNSRKVTHLFRHRYDCIISTSKSINYDNSLLNCRINGLNNDKPDLFIIDLNLKIKKDLLLNKLLKRRKTFLVTRDNKSKKILFLKKLGYKFVFIKSLNSQKDFHLLFQKMYKMGYPRVLVESGLTFLNHLLKNKIIHELFIFKSNTKLGINGSNNVSSKHLRKISPKLLTINLNDDKLYKKEFNYV